MGKITAMLTWPELETVVLRETSLQRQAVERHVYRTTDRDAHREEITGPFYRLVG